MPRHTEPSANTALANILRRMMHGCNIRSESTRTIAGNKGLQPDILITASDRAPVVIEAEFMPAYSVEDDAAARLALTVIGGRREIEAAIALRYPAGLEDAYDLDAELKRSRHSYCVLTAPDEDDADFDRFPESGWLEGSVADVAELARLVSVPQRTVNAAASALENGIDSAVGVLNEMERQSPVAAREIADLLGMSEVPQTRRMACAIMANAMVFHDRIAHMHKEILPLNRLWEDDADNPQGKVSEAWDAILQINYWPIFAVARDIVNLLPSHAAARILEHLRTTAHRINSTGANVAHDLTGRVFQRLIVDRKYLATFYTLPASAALLARLAVDKLQKVAPSTADHKPPLPAGEGWGEGQKPSPSSPSMPNLSIDWSDPAAIANLRIGDFACGTGALLSAVYEQIATRHEQAGGNPAALHTAMMEDVLYGCDVMPSAIHITSSTLSGREPNVGFGGSRLYNMPYGRQQDGTVAIGSLELLQSSSVMTLFNTSDPALRTGSTGEETAASVIVDVQDESFDIVIMNPPFTRATNHEGAHADITNPAFAAFNATREDQTAMGRRLNQLGRSGAYHGNAGIASAFAALGHRKLKTGGVLAMVLPLSAAVGLSWQNFRDVLTQNYTDISVLSIAANGRDMAFSSDTGMAECLVVARKLRKDESSSGVIEFTSFTRRPQKFEHAAAIASVMTDAKWIRDIDDGPYGGTSLMVGDEKTGEMLTAPRDKDDAAWAAVRLSDSSLAQTAYALASSNLWLPGAAKAMELITATLGTVGKLGLVHRDITGPAPRGPFDKVAASPTATYPALWNHNASKEKRIACKPDSQLTVRQGLEQKAAVAWKSASRSHLNAEYTFGSQPLAVAVTDKNSLGGSAWPNVIFADERYDYTFSVWSNSTLGLLSYWWHSSRQQSSKARMTIRTAETLPILDLRTLTDDQLATAKDIFDDFRNRDLMPAYLADADPNRAHLDKRVLCDLLRFHHDIYQAVRLLAAKWCAEPSVHGGKRRPRNATLTI